MGSRPGTKRGRKWKYYSLELVVIEPAILEFVVARVQSQNFLSLERAGGAGGRQQGSARAFTKGKRLRKKNLQSEPGTCLNLLGLRGKNAIREDEEENEDEETTGR